MSNSIISNIVKLYVPVSLLIVTTGCGGKSSSSGEAAGTDTTATVENVTPEPAQLPDTVFPSVSAINYKVEVIDTVNSGVIDNLRDLYATTPGAFTFRKDAVRDADFGGSVKGTPSEIVVDWAFKTDFDTRETSLGTWGGGSGWTGQPLYVEWPDSCVSRFRRGDAITADFSKNEIIVGSLASRIYFINFETGKASRRPIDTSNPIKGTISLDPTLNGNLYFGQGVPAVRPFGARVIDLYKHAVTHEFNEDPKAQRRWGAYDSSPVRVGQFLFRPGENGTLYKFSIAPGTLSLHSTLRYTAGGTAPGMESSMSVYRNYGFVGDNHGNLLCVNLNTMKPVWRYDLRDDIDATPVVCVEEGGAYVYVGCEIDLRKEGSASFVKLDALTGKVVWSTEFTGKLFAIGKKHFDGGFYATPLPGSGNCADLIFTNVVRNQSGQNGEFVAISRKDGKVVYSTPLHRYAWSSPVGFLNEKNELFVFTADCAGNAYIIEGRTGRIIVRKPVGNNFESSPVVKGNSLVVGSRGDTIYKLSLK